MLDDFASDEAAGVWRWLPVTSALIRSACERVVRLPRRTLLRAGDAIHLGCAREHGFREVYTNDGHMLAACRHFDLIGVNILSG